MLRTSVLLLVLSPAVAHAAIYSESIHGDLSNNRLLPTSIAIDEAGLFLPGAVTNTDPDYFTLAIPQGKTLSAILLNQYTSSNSRAFIGLQSGTALTVDPSNPDPSLLLGYAHFGFDNPVGSDLLAGMSNVPGTIGFTAPLPPGDYTFWLNQTEPPLTQYAFTFVVPEAQSSLLILVVSASLFRRRRLLSE